MHRYPEPDTTPVPSNDWTIWWKMSFSFSSDPPDGVVRAGWGDTEMGGVFDEELVGLTSDLVKARGTFLLRRASTVFALNEGASN